jgi:hypothetical protein
VAEGARGVDAEAPIEAQQAENALASEPGTIETMTDVDASADVGLEPTMEDAPSAGSVAPSDRTAAILAASNGNWIEAIAPFVPSDGSSSSDAASPSEQMRRRRRRGGRRGGRGRRPGPGTGEHREDSLSPVPDTQAAGSVTEAGAPPQAHDASSDEGPRSPARRRRRRGGSGRRRTALDGRSATEGADRTVTASAEPPADS